MNKSSIINVFYLEMVFCSPYSYLISRFSFMFFHLFWKDVCLKFEKLYFFDVCWCLILGFSRHFGKKEEYIFNFLRIWFTLNVFHFFWTKYDFGNWQIFHFIWPNLEDEFEFEFSIDNDKNIEKLPQTEILEFLFFHNTNLV